MNIQERYTYVMKEIELGHRALIRLSAEELEELNQALTLPEENLEEVLCLVEHSASLYQNFEDHLIKILQGSHSPRIKIFALNSARKHIILARFQKGLRLHFDFLEVLKTLLHAPSPEVVEWTLRTIEECGNQGVYFLKEFDKIKPPPWKWFNPHQRAVREIITLLERRWSRFERS
jgi:hypothetical protein